MWGTPHFDPSLRDFLYSKFGEIDHLRIRAKAVCPSEYETADVFYLKSRNVTLVRYPENEIEGKRQVISLFGDERAIGEVERIILEETRKHESVLSGR